VDGLRLILLEDEYGRTGVSASDFHRPIDKPAASKGVDSIALRCVFDDLDGGAQASFQPWLDVKDRSRARLNLVIDNKEDQRGRFKRRIWGGESQSSIFESDLLDRIWCLYLPPLRDAEARLGAYRGSRLARLLRNIGKRRYAEQKHPLETRVKAFNDLLLQDDTISEANKSIRNNVASALGQTFSQDAMVQFSEVRFERIVEQLRLLFYPRFPEQDETTPRELFRDLSENSLGFNNVLFLATVLAEIEAAPGETFLKLLLIEEPEAHLHPQLQVRLLAYLQDKAKESDIQVILTTHSPTIAASVDLDTIKVLTRASSPRNPSVSSIADCGLPRDTQFFIKRWLDVTKSTLLFAKGVLLVEGIAELLVIPELAKIILADNGAATQESLADYGVALISMGGIYFKHFMQLFIGYEPNSERTQCDRIPIGCAGITDCDPSPTDLPTEATPSECHNPQLFLLKELAQHENCRLFGNLKTFEYDLALQGNNLQLMTRVYSRMPPMARITKSDRDKATRWAASDWTAATVQNKADTAGLLLEMESSIKGEFAQHLALELSGSVARSTFTTPEYIKKAVLWACGLT
jgi:predicted ATP-dependent endonuclease of OLD family